MEEVIGSVALIRIGIKSGLNAIIKLVYEAVFANYPLPENQESCSFTLHFRSNLGP